MTTTTKTTNKPVFRKVLPGGLSIAVFERHHEGRTYRSLNLQRSYKKNNDWVRSNIYLDHQQIPFAIELLQGTWNYLNETPVQADVQPEEAPADEPIVA